MGEGKGRDGKILVSTDYESAGMFMLITHWPLFMWLCCYLHL